MKPKVLIIIAIIAVIAILWIFVQSPSPTVTDVPIEGADTTSAVIEDIEGLDLGNIDAEFEAIDADLESL